MTLLEEILYHKTIYKIQRAWKFNNELNMLNSQNFIFEQNFIKSSIEYIFLTKQVLHFPNRHQFRLVFLKAFKINNYMKDV